MEQYIDHVFVEPPFIRQYAHFAGTIQIGSRSITLPEGTYVSTGGIVTIERLFQAARDKGLEGVEFKDEVALTA